MAICKGCGRSEGEKASILACLPCEMLETNCSPQLKVRRGNIQTAVLLKVLYNWSSLALVSSLVHCCMNRADILEAAKTAKDDYNKELPTTGKWSTIHRVTSPRRHIRRVGWSVCIVHATTPGDICEVTTCHCGIMDQLVEHRLTASLRIRLLVCVCVSVCSQRPCMLRMSKSGVF